MCARVYAGKQECKTSQVVMSGMEPKDMAAKQENLDRTGDKWHCIQKPGREIPARDLYYNWAKKPAECCKHLKS